MKDGAALDVHGNVTFSANTAVRHGGAVSLPFAFGGACLFCYFAIHCALLFEFLLLALLFLFLLLQCAMRFAMNGLLCWGS